VGNEKGFGYFCPELQAICSKSKCAGLRAKGTSFSKCFDPALARKSRTDDADAKDKAAAQAATQAGLHDKKRSGPFLVDSAAHSTSGTVLSNRLVHWLTAKRYHRPQMVDGES
jgi:hypothetical protein